MNRPARFTSADARRAARAAEAAGPDWAVEILPDGTIRIVRLRQQLPAKVVEPIEEVVL